MEAVAKHDFVPSDPSSELAFQKGDKLCILNYGDEVSWYDAEKNGQSGLVPNNYIQIEAPAWYMGRISRSTAEQMLQNNNREGAFLVRKSESAPSEFSLSVKCGNSVQHFRILKVPLKTEFFLWQDKFGSINELVEHYRRETVSRTSHIVLCDMNTDDQLIVQAIYDFLPEQTDPEGDTELYFRKGDIITVFDTSDDNWWGGSIGERSGFFPRLYVKQFNAIANNHP